MPAPGPVPTSQPNVRAMLPPARIAGSKTKSDNGPAMSRVISETAPASASRVANTRPCIAGGILDCQSALLQLPA